jgi:hypothetical protein
VALGFDIVPDVFELAVGTDKERTSHDAEKRFAEEFLHTAGAVGFDGLEIRIAKEIEIEFLFGFETGLGFNGVAAHAENNHAKLVELLFCVAKLGRFNGSPGGVGLRVEEEHDVFSAEIREGDIVASVVLQTKRGGLVAYF